MSFFKFFSKKKPASDQPAATAAAPRKKYSGLSQKSVGNSVRQAIPGNLLPTQPASKPNGGTAGKAAAPASKLREDAGIYLSIIKGDISRMLGFGAEARMMKEEYNDFMEQHFGRRGK